MMLQQERPDDFVIATGETHSVREFAELAFLQVGLTGKNTWTSIRVTSGRQRLTSCREMLPKLEHNWVGGRKLDLKA